MSGDDDGQHDARPRQWTATEPPSASSAPRTHVPQKVGAQTLVEKEYGTAMRPAAADGPAVKPGAPEGERARDGVNATRGVTPQGAETQKRPMSGSSASPSRRGPHQGGPPKEPPRGARVAGKPERGTAIGGAAAAPTKGTSRPPPTPAPAISVTVPAGDVDGIVAALGDREASVEASFVAAKVRANAIASVQSDHARGEANTAAGLLEAHAAIFSTRLYTSADAEGRRATQAVSDAIAQINAGAHGLQGQVGAAAEVALGSVSDATSEERDAVRTALASARESVRDQVEGTRFWNGLYLHADGHDRADTYLGNAGEMTSQMTPAIDDAASTVRAAGQAVVEQIGNLTMQTLIALDAAHTQVRDGIRGARVAAAASLTSRVDGDGPSRAAREHHLRTFQRIDSFVATLDGLLGAGTQDLEARCVAAVTLAHVNYLGSDAQSLTHLDTQAVTLETKWRADADAGVAAARRSTADTLQAFAEVQAGLAAKLADAADEVVTRMRRSWYEVAWDATTGFVGGVATWVAVGLATAVFIAVTAPADLAVAAIAGLAAEATAAMLLVYTLMKSSIDRGREAAQKTADFPWYVQMLAQVNATFAAVGDTTMAAPLAESVTGYDAMDGRELSRNDRIERFTGAAEGLALGTATHAALDGIGKKPASANVAGRESLSEAPVDAETETGTQTGGTSPAGTQAEQAATHSATSSADTSNDAEHASRAHTSGGPADGGHARGEKGATAADSSVVDHAVKTTSGRVSEPRPGLYENLNVDDDPPGWTFRESPIKYEGKNRTTRVIETTVYGPNNKSGRCIRAYDPTTNKLEMREAFLDNLPRWINDGGVQLVDGKGTPTIAYVTMRQMKHLGIDYGSLKTVKMSSIQNIRSIIELHVARSEGIDPDVAVLNTHSVQYAETPLIQSGHNVVSAKVGGNIWIKPLDFLLEFRETRGSAQPRDPTLVAEHDRMIAEIGKGMVDRNTEVWMNYDIELKLTPFSGGE